LIKLDIINHVVNQTGLAKTKAEKVVETVFESIKDERVEFRAFGIFEVRPRKTGIGRNPRNGIEVPIPPGKSIRFRPGKGLRDLKIKNVSSGVSGTGGQLKARSHPRPPSGLALFSRDSRVNDPCNRSSHNRRQPK